MPRAARAWRSRAAASWTSKLAARASSTKAVSCGSLNVRHHVVTCGGLGVATDGAAVCCSVTPAQAGGTCRALGGWELGPTLHPATQKASVEALLRCAKDGRRLLKAEDP